MTKTSKVKQPRFWKIWEKSGAIGTISEARSKNFVSLVPKITAKELWRRRHQIKFVTQAMSGLDGKAHITQETDKSLFDLFYVQSNVKPRTQAFNFDEERVITDKAIDLVEIGRKNILVKIGGYYGFCKVTMAEVMSQIPDNLLPSAVAFAFDPNDEASILNSDYQHMPIIIYGKGQTEDKDKDSPTSVGLIKPTDLAKAEKFKDKIKPAILYNGGDNVFLDPGDVNEPFLHIGIWVRINGSNLHKTNEEIKIDVPFKEGEKIIIYQEFTGNTADSFAPTYAQTISQFPDELLTEKTIGFVFKHVDYFRTKEGILHKIKYTLLETVDEPKEIPSRVSGRVKQFVEGTGDW